MINAFFKPTARFKTDFPLALGFTTAVLFFVISGALSYSNLTSVRDDTQWVVHTHGVLMGLSDVLSSMRNAESAERGFVISGDESYLTAYKLSIERARERIQSLEELTKDNPMQNGRVVSAQATIDARIGELDSVIKLRRTSGIEAARRQILSNRGRDLMEDLRGRIDEMQQEERTLRQERVERMEKSYRGNLTSVLLTTLVGVALSMAVALLVNRSIMMRRREEWLQAGQIGLSNAAAGDQTVDMLGQNILQYLSEYLDAKAGAFFVKNGHGYRRVATYGVPADSRTSTRFDEGDGLLGQAVRDAKPFFVHDVPDNYLTLGSSLGQGAPRHLVISPAVFEENVNAVFELGFLQQPSEDTIELLREAADFIGVAVRSSKYRSELQDLLEETQRQSEELQAQSEELRVSNEELEEQSRALKETQSRLEQQQVELEQSNAQLEEQTQQLEIQRDDLSRAQLELQARAYDLEQASQYKSDFLANMSHELRTPLNSSLILAKLLADNPKGNLTDEQVKFAQTIQSSGNDLLVLINDILDLSKIEAGHMEIRPESVPVEWLFNDLKNMFDPIGKEKGVALKTKIEKNAPKSIETDRQRLEQVLKNLMSNAFKFTEKGSVTLGIEKTADGEVAISVTDTGIGITEENQKVIFDAFRQADGTISRKYGGTGLGLSISRELMRLLGGRVDLTSTFGQGSTFTLYLPVKYSADNIQTTRAIMPPPADTGPSDPPVAKTAPSIARTSRLTDDREDLKKGGRVILVIEDDESFAGILKDLAHAMNFQCLIAGTAEEALAISRQYLPSAVVLDVGLPDNSGLSVLDRLKRDPKTRHIPVHVVSADDYAETAYSLGAIGYMLKPVKREELEDAFRGLEARLISTMRRVLLVEDDKVQRESVMKLLDTRDVETVAVGTAAECLEKLKHETFDCMILDLSLPDGSGYTLLETLSQGSDYSFPPVIVYTGRDLKGADEQRLRRYSKSIIIKGAKSPERLLDEVTLFLHQVVSDLPAEQQKMLEKARHRDSILEGRRILIAEDDIRNVYAVTNIFEPLGATVQIARNGREALEMLEKSKGDASKAIHLVLMDVMMPEMDGLTATRKIRQDAKWKKLPIIMLTAKAMKDDQERCMEAGANDYMAKPLDVEKLLSLVRVWMPR